MKKTNLKEGEKSFTRNYPPKQHGKYTIINGRLSDTVGKRSIVVFETCTNTTNKSFSLLLGRESFLRLATAAAAVNSVMHENEPSDCNGKDSFSPHHRSCRYNREQRYADKEHRKSATAAASSYFASCSQGLQSSTGTFTINALMMVIRALEGGKRWKVASTEPLKPPI